MKRSFGAVLLATGVGILACQATRTPIYAASDGLQTNQSSGSAAQDATADLAKAGSKLFVQNCAFCHGRDAMGGETGPDKRAIGSWARKTSMALEAVRSAMRPPETLRALLRAMRGFVWKNRCSILATPRVG